MATYLTGVAFRASAVDTFFHAPTTAFWVCPSLSARRSACKLCRHLPDRRRDNGLRPVDDQPCFLPMVLAKPLLPGSFEFVLSHLVDSARCRWKRSTPSIATTRPERLRSRQRCCSSSCCWGAPVA